jgi:hypothetical protein
MEEKNYIHAFGPESDFDELSGIETPVWFVSIMDNDDYPIADSTWKCWDPEDARKWGIRLSKIHNLELVDEIGGA